MIRRAEPGPPPRKRQHRTLLAHGELAAQRQGARCEGSGSSGWCPRAWNSTTPRARSAPPRAASTPHAIFRRRPCYPMAKFSLQGEGGAGNLSSAELYDPASGSWSATGSLNSARSFHTATLLSSGKVLVGGGVSLNNQSATAELYDPASGTWTATGSLNTARTYHTATLLSNGMVLVAGGWQ